MLATGVAKGYIAGLEEDDLTSTELSILGVDTESSFLATIEQARRNREDAVVLFPSEDAKEATMYCPLFRHVSKIQQRSRSNSNKLFETLIERQRLLSDVSMLSTRLNALRNRLEQTLSMTATTSVTHHEAKGTSISVKHFTSEHSDLLDHLKFTEALPPLHVVVLDGTYRHARLLNRKHIPPWLPRIKISACERSRFMPLRNGGDARAEMGRTSTLEAVAQCLSDVDPEFGRHQHLQRWRSELEFMVDEVRRQRGRPTAYNTDCRQR